MLKLANKRYGQIYFLKMHEFKISITNFTRKHTSNINLTIMVVCSMEHGACEVSANSLERGRERVLRF